MRLTERKYGEIVSSKREKEPIQCSTFCNNCSQGTGNCNYVKEMVEKLAKYEDLEEQCIEENQCGLRELLLKWKEFFDDIAELYEYRKAEEQGLLLRLPCKVGDTVYITERYRWDGSLEKGVIPILITEIKISYEENKIKFFVSCGGRYFNFDEFGKTVFLTKEEAESALAEKGGAE